jgi:hypothetical protein
MIDGPRVIASRYPDESERYSIGSTFVVPLPTTMAPAASSSLPTRKNGRPCVSRPAEYV